MATEARRGCGYRKVGGLYLVASGFGVPCDRLPFPLDVCPCCKQGIKQARGWSWIDLFALVGGRHEHCADILPGACKICNPKQGQKAGLLWVGEKFYPTPQHFAVEANSQGISKRIKAIPRGFKLGEDWVLLAHPKAILKQNTEREEYIAGIFRAFKPERVEQLIWKSQATEEKLADLQDAGITPVIIPDGDKDHAGSVYDKEEAEEVTIQ